MKNYTKKPNKQANKTLNKLKNKGNKMIDTVTEHTFIDTMATKDNGFSYEGSRALYNYLEDYEQDTETQIEFDPIALRCEYTEYKNFEEIKKEYDTDYCTLETLEDLQDHTQVILINESDSIPFNISYPTKQEPRNREQITNDLIAKGLVKILDREGWDCRISKASLKLIFDTEKQEQKLINDTYNKQVKEYDQQVKEYNKNNIHSYEGIIIQNF